MTELPSDFVHKCTPYAHQQTALELSWARTYFALFLDMGCGKSKILIDTACALYLDGKIDAVLLLAPKGVYMTWIDQQLPTHMPDNVPYFASYWVSNPKPDLQKSWGNYRTFKGLRWFVMNIEALSYEKGQKFAFGFTKYFVNRMLAAVDESTAIKAPSTSCKRTKAAITIARNARYRRILTGQPTPNSPLDLYSQCEFLSAGLLGASSYHSFKARHAVIERAYYGPRSFPKIAGYKNIDVLSTKLTEFSCRVSKDDCLDLPPKTYETWDVELTNEQLDLYKKIKEEMLFMFKDQIVTAVMAITQLIRLHQVTCGFVRSEDKENLSVKNNRLDTLLEVIEGMSGSVVIWATYRHNIACIAEVLKKHYGKDSVVMYYGAISQEDRRQAIELFQGGKARFFIGNPATGRFGLTLAHSANMIYYSNSFNLEHRIQSEDRIHRIGQKHSCVTYVDLVSKNSIDEKIVHALRSKKQLASMVTGDNYKEWI